MSPAEIEAWKRELIDRGEKPGPFLGVGSRARWDPERRLVVEEGPDGQLFSLSLKHGKLHKSLLRQSHPVLRMEKSLTKKSL
jgi:hypothetical protein